jgi:hypothetical protein
VEGPGEKWLKDKLSELNYRRNRTRELRRRNSARVDGSSDVFAAVILLDA